VNGRKRHILVDVLGLLLVVVVHPAHWQDRDGARLVLAIAKRHFGRLRWVWADAGYAGQLVEWVAGSLNWVLEIVKRSAQAVGFVRLPRRWVVERTFAWLGRYRRLSQDYEALTTSSEAMIRLAMIQLMLHRLVPS
jgi:putative transposase